MPESSIIALVIAVNVVFLGVLIWKAAWLMRKIRGYPTTDRGADGAVASARQQDGTHDSLRGQADADEQADKQQ